MCLTPLPTCSVELLLDGLFQAAVIVTGDQVDIPQTACFQVAEEVTPGFFTFSVGDSKSQNLAVTFLIDSDSNQETLRFYTAIFPGFHVDRIHNQKGILSIQRPVSKPFHNRIQFLAKCGDGLFGEAGTAQCLCDLADFSCGYALNNHF